MMTENEVYKYIEVNPTKGRASVFWGTTITPEHILSDIEKGMSLEDILKHHPKLTAKHLEAAVVYANTFPTDDERLLIVAANLFSSY